ncbi:membrane protein insertase YidC [Gordonia sp. CPCC 205515]|uniref:membrane protein insertase YidC n=1 Tax=Gordonia sp. CPCC 205515 TaxID=3140791 RepID=UPI003AF337C6
MLNFIYYPVSGIMWVWHWLFDFITPNTPGGNGIAWALSVVFLVFTLRAILYKPFVKQIRTTKKMQEINPQMQAIRKKYAKDRVKMTEEMQKLQKEHSFNPLLGCLPMLLQVPVFIGLFHVLRSFNRTATGMGQLGMSPEETREVPNYFFSVEQVQSFLDARFFGVPLSSFITQPVEQWKAFIPSGNLADIDFTRANIIIVVIPIMIIASIATHMNSRASVARQPAESLENPQTRMMNMLALYIFPLGILVTGPFFPVAILLYWVSNNVWTYGQQHIVFGRIAKEEEEAKLAKQEKQKANAPKPGARPDQLKLTKQTDAGDEVVDSEIETAAVVEHTTVEKSSSPLQTVQGWLRPKKSTPAADAGDTLSSAAETTGTTPTTGTSPTTSKKPAPGQKPTGAKTAGNKQNPSGSAKRRKKGGRPGGRQ